MGNKKSWGKWVIKFLFSGSKQKATPRKSQTKPQAESTESEVYVLITKSGKKFHHDVDCPALKNAWAHDEVIRISRSKARASGRTVCDKCRWG